MNDKEKPIRIGHIVGKMMGGGVEAMLMNYYRHINKNKIQFDFIIDNDSTIVPYDEIALLGGRVLKIAPYQKIHQYNKDLFALFKENNYSIIHSHINSLSVFPLRIAKKAGIPIRIAHSHSTSAPGELSKNILKNILRPVANIYPTHFCACSKSAGDWLFGKSISKKDQLQIVNNGIEIDKFYFNESYRKKIRNELKIENKFVIGHTGRLSYQKNQKFLINLLPDIIKIKSNAILLLIGDGTEKNELIKLAQDLKVKERVLFLGNRIDVYRYYNAMDVFVFPSKYEGFGISAIEAQVSGMPVVTSEAIPVEAYLTNKCKSVSLKENKTTWVEAIVNEKANNRYDNEESYYEFEIKENAIKLEKFYLEILNERERRSI